MHLVEQIVGGLSRLAHVRFPDVREHISGGIFPGLPQKLLGVCLG